MRIVFMFKGRCICCQTTIKTHDKSVKIGNTINNIPIVVHDYCYDRHEIQLKVMLAEYV